MKPILFSGPMVNAILEDRKVMTRRVVKNPDHYGCLTGDCGHWDQRDCDKYIRHYGPYGAPGDQLWVRETFAIYDGSQVEYRATPFAAGKPDCGWTPSIFMPRWACRLYLTITDVRVERLQDISEEDAIAEGITLPAQNERIDKILAESPLRAERWTARDYFTELWDSINAKPKPVKTDGVIAYYVSYPWEDVQETREYRGKPWHVVGNPWVWVVSFKRDSTQRGE